MTDPLATHKYFIERSFPGARTEALELPLELETTIVELLDTAPDLIIEVGRILYQLTVQQEDMNEGLRSAHESLGE